MCISILLRRCLNRKSESKLSNKSKRGWEGVLSMHISHQPCWSMRGLKQKLKILPMFHYSQAFSWCRAGRSGSLSYGKPRKWFMTNYRPCSIVKQGDNALGIVPPFVCPPVCSNEQKSHYQSKVFVCVSVISRCMPIIAQVQSFGF